MNKTCDWCGKHKHKTVTVNDTEKICTSCYSSAKECSRCGKLISKDKQLFCDSCHEIVYNPFKKKEVQKK